MKRNILLLVLKIDPKDLNCATVIAADKLGKEKLGLVANSYMEKIGFGKQPILVLPAL